MSISEQVNTLKELAEKQDAEYKKRIISRAADTIESLSVKLQAANMERSRKINANEILKEIREKAQELSNQHWGDDERHLIGKGIQCMRVQAENIINKHMERSTVDLRPCIVQIREETIMTRNAYGERNKKVIKEAETHKGYFHTWGSETYVTNGFLVGETAGQISALYGVVEYEDGTVHKVSPECITFTDRGIKD